MTPSAPPPVGTAKPRKLGCWFYGCTSLFLVVVLGAVALYFGTRALFRSLRDNFTATEPVMIERVELPPAQWTNLQERIESFSQALETGQAQELVLTEEELNAFIDHNPKFKDVADRIHATIQGEQLGGKISLPLPDTGFLKWAGLGGRYVNGNATFDVNLENGQLQVYLQDMTVNNKPVPKEFLQEFRKNNLARDKQQDPDTQAAIAKYESIQVTDGKIVLKSKAQQPRIPEPEAVPNQP